MGVIRNAANQKIRGRVGATTYYVSEGRQIARQALNNSNYGATAKRTPAQQSNRVKWANLVNFYKACRSWMPKAFETKKAGQSDYNRLMQVNLPYTNIYLTRNQAAVGATIAEGYIISQGSLPSVELQQVGGYYNTNIYTGNLTITSQTTVAQFTAALVVNNINIKEGMQLSFVSILQVIDSLGVPRLNVAFYEVTLSSTNTNPVYNYLPDLCCISNEGSLACRFPQPLGAFTYVVSDARSGKLLVSTQRLTTYNGSVIAAYSSAAQLAAAIESYKVDEGVILDPSTTNAQDEQPVPQFIVNALLNGTYYNYGDQTITPAQLTGAQSLSFAASIDGEEVDEIGLETIDGENLLLVAGAISGNSLAFTAGEGLSSTSPIESIYVLFADGTQYTIKFADKYAYVAGED